MNLAINKLLATTLSAMASINKLTKVSSSTIYKVLKEHLGYVSNRLVKLEETEDAI